MTQIERPTLKRRLLSAIEADPPRIPIVLGLGGSGRTALLLELQRELGNERSQYLDVEQAATTPEHFLRSLTANSPFNAINEKTEFSEALSTREAFQAALRFLDRARPSATNPAIFLLDEILDLRTFENFPGLRLVLKELIETLRNSHNRFVLSTRYTTRALRLLRDASPQFEIVHLPAFTPAEVGNALATVPTSDNYISRDELARSIHALTAGRPSYVRLIAEGMEASQEPNLFDPVAALATQLSKGASLWAQCRFEYELRLHRARGYGVLQAIVQILANEEPLKLTEIARRLGRTPGSTRDYLSWLEDVDLVTVRQKRYRLADPLLRLWVKLHCQPTPISDEQLAREVQKYAYDRLPRNEPTTDDTNFVSSKPTREWNVID